MDYAAVFFKALFLPKIRTAHGASHASKRIEDFSELTTLRESREQEFALQERPRDGSERKFQRATRCTVARWVWAFSGSLPFVAVVQPPTLRHQHNRPHFRRLNRWWFRRVLPRLITMTPLSPTGSVIPCSKLLILRVRDVLMRDNHTYLSRPTRL